jgi:hypothetical protein
MIDLRTAVPCLLCGKDSKSVQAHFRHFYTCNPKVRLGKLGNK